MSNEKDRDEPSEKTPRPDQDDQLSPSRALRESVGKSGGPRVGDSGPLANPTISSQEEPETQSEQKP
jgi:hypothetical protein